jgi:hypothetical protein
MELRRIEFRGGFPEPHLSIDCWPPFAEVNKIFVAAFQACVAPYQLAIDCGKLGEETSLKVWIKCYATGVVAKSVTPGYEKMRESDWVKFFTDHPEHFEELRAVCEHSRNWDCMTTAAAGGNDGISPVEQAAQDA